LKIMCRWWARGYKRGYIRALLAELAESRVDTGFGLRNPVSTIRQLNQHRFGAASTAAPVRA
jgi:hypothetical protein